MKDAQTSKVSTGTSIDVLAPYLPYGIEVQHRDGSPSEKLIGLCYNATELVNVEWHDKPGKNYWHGAKYCLPVLFGFADLCTPLADGSVPALLVAGAAVPEVKCARAEIVNMGFGQFCCMCYGEQGQQYYSIHRNNFESVRGSRVKNRLDGDLTDLLRKLHFALPINGRPLVEGQDYIRKAPATPTASPPTPTTL